MSCVVQQLQNPQPATVPEIGTCCSNLVTPVAPINIVLKNVNAHILTGIVLCGGSGVSDVIVVASLVTGSRTSYYVGLTNSSGIYSICVPVAGDYTVQAYKCCCNTSTSDTCSCQ